MTLNTKVSCDKQIIKILLLFHLYPFYFSCLIALCLILEEKYQSFLIKNDASCGFCFIQCLLSWSMPLLTSLCWITSFYWVLSKASFIYIHMILLFYLIFYWCGIWHKFIWMCEPSLHPWNKFLLVMVYDPFNVVLNSVCQDFVDTCLSIQEWYWFGGLSVVQGVCLALLA